jgi:hypothetical protein
MNVMTFITMDKLEVAPVSVKANLRKQVKRSGHSQNRWLQKRLPA